MKALNGNPPVKAALCSFGMSGRIFHAPFLKVSPLFDLVAALERSKSLSKQMFPGIRIYRKLDDLLSDEAIELVIVNTPNFTHYDYAMEALQAGKHVVVEKPFTVYAKEGVKLKNEAEKRGLLLSVYHNRRYDSDFKTIEKILGEKIIGEVVEAEMRFDRFRLRPGKKLHKENPGPGTGNLYDLGSHLIDQALLLFGMPDHLFADIRIVGQYSKVDNYFELLLYYSKLSVRLHSSYLVADPLPGYIFYGDKGSFIKPKTNIQEEDLSKGRLPGSRGWGVEPAGERGLLKTVSNGNFTELKVTSERGNYGEFYDILYSAIRKNTPVPVDPQHAINVVRLIELAYKSNDLKKVVPVGKPNNR